MYNFLGQIPLSQGDNDAAARLVGQGLDAARRVPDRFALLISLYDLALSSQAREDLAGAAGFLREGLSVASGAGDESSVGLLPAKAGGAGRATGRRRPGCPPAGRRGCAAAGRGHRLAGGLRSDGAVRR
jgi:hypothetical protein